MTARFSTRNHSTDCCSSAAACSSARIIPLMDTAVIRVVSICVVILLSIRLGGV